MSPTYNIENQASTKISTGAKFLIVLSWWLLRTHTESNSMPRFSMPSSVLQNWFLESLEDSDVVIVAVIVVVVVGAVVVVIVYFRRASVLSNASTRQRGH